jgi:hypothetical protein
VRSSHTNESLRARGIEVLELSGKGFILPMVKPSAD